MGSKFNAIRNHQDDNVVVLIEAASQGGRIVYEGGELIARQDIPKGHKAALVRIGCGQKIIRYGAAIGLAAMDIEPGHMVHTHNIRSEGL